MIWIALVAAWTVLAFFVWCLCRMSALSEEDE